MARHLKYKNTAGDEAIVPTAFIVICVAAFVAAVSATIYFFRSMCCDMEMPGGWTMSMMWMQMPHQTWLASALSFLLMWLAMMVAMMMPSALPTFLKTRRHGMSLLYMTLGYFAIWLIAGFVIYPLGVELAKIEMQSELISRTVPLVSGVSLIAAGTIQFTPWKMKHLCGCRSKFACASTCTQHETSFRLGCKQGMTCCLCCAPPMMILLVLGVMNPVAMIIVAVVIAAEKLLPRPDIAAYLVGIATIVTGITIVLGGDLL